MFVKHFSLRWWQIYSFLILISRKNQHGNVCETVLFKMVREFEIFKYFSYSIIYSFFLHMVLISPCDFSWTKHEKSIYQHGGKKFWVHNTGPLGCLPQQLATTSKNASDIDQYGCLQSRNDGAREFNKQLKALCEELRDEIKDATIVYVDIFSIKYDLIANSTRFGEFSSFEPLQFSPFELLQIDWEVLWVF